jgi:hypothetical protein
MSSVVMRFLQDDHKLVQSDGYIEVKEKPSEEQLLKVHSKAYLESLKSSYTVRHSNQSCADRVFPGSYHHGGEV